MKRIRLTRGKFALVDDQDFPQLSQYKWHARPSKGTFYAGRTVRTNPHVNSSTRTILMHIEILGGKGVDHKNGNGLDNRRQNLRFATQSQNTANAKIYCTNKSGTKGVGWYKRYAKWYAQIYVNYRTFSLGYFSDKSDAITARKKAEQHYFGEFAR